MVHDGFAIYVADTLNVCDSLSGNIAFLEN